MHQACANCDEIRAQLASIENKLDALAVALKNVENSAGKMDGHIDFVEDVYDKVKAPFFKAMSLIQAFRPPRPRLASSSPP
jgi:septation ring formation regulator EzrA